jgi:hypothetical protein
MSHEPERKDKHSDVAPQPVGRTGEGVASVVPFLHKQALVKIPVPLDELLSQDDPPQRGSASQGADLSPSTRPSRPTP